MEKNKNKLSDKDFAKQISEWLTPKGFSIIFENHPNNPEREYHYIKDGIRIICTNNAKEGSSHVNQCYLHKDLINQRTALISWKFDIGENIHLDREWTNFKNVLDTLFASNPILM